MRNEHLRTVKMTTYKLDDVIQKLETPLPKPKTVVVHVGTNDIRDGSSPTEVLSKYKNIVKKCYTKFPGAKVILSNIVDRDDLTETIAPSYKNISPW